MKEMTAKQKDLLEQIVGLLQDDPEDKTQAAESRAMFLAESLQVPYAEVQALIAAQL